MINQFRWGLRLGVLAWVCCYLSDALGREYMPGSVNVYDNPGEVLHLKKFLKRDSTSTPFHFH